MITVSLEDETLSRQPTTCLIHAIDGSVGGTVPTVVASLKFMAAVVEVPRNNVAGCSAAAASASYLEQGMVMM